MTAIKNYLQTKGSSFFRDGLLTLSEIAPCRTAIPSNGQIICDGHILSVSNNRAEKSWTHPCPCFYYQNNIDSELFSLLFYFEDANEIKKLEKYNEQFIAGKKNNLLAWNSIDAKDICIEQWRLFLLNVYLKSDIENRIEKAELDLKLIWKNNLNTAQKKSLNFAQQLMHLKFLFAGAKHYAVSWAKISKYYDLDISTRDSLRSQFLEKIEARKNIVLLLEDEISTHKSGLNSSVASFENFVEDCNRLNLGLVVFSCRELLQPDQSDFSLSFDYNVDRRRSYRDEKNKMRFTSTRTAVRSTQSMQELLKIGAFDRLVECLDLGQRWLDTIV